MVRAAVAARAGDTVTMKELAPPGTLPADGRTTPAARILDDPDWLREAYTALTDAQIAAILGCTPGRVWRARAKHHIPSRRRGVQRGSGQEMVGSEQPVVERIREQRGMIAATEATLKRRIVALAHSRADADAYADALLDLAAAAALIHEHQQKLRAA